MDKRAFLLLQVLANTLVFSGAQFMLQSCMEGNTTTARLNCQNGNIYSVNVLARTSSCTSSKAGCSGKTPSLLVNQLNCYWLSNCVITWPRDPIIMTENNDMTCIGSDSTSVSVSYKCIQPTDYQVEGSPRTVTTSGRTPRTLFADICNSVVNGSSIADISGDADLSGIIRSHKFYPWGYSAEYRNCSIRMKWPEAKGKKLVITVHNIDLYDDDSLIVGNEKPANVTVVTGEPLVFANEEITFFNFSVGNESNGGEGFVLCFKFIAVEDTTSADVCETITKTGAVIVEGNQSQGTKTSEATPELPKRCRKKKTEKARKRCAAKMAARKKGGRKGKKKGDKKKSKRKPKNEKGRNKKKSKKQQN